MAACYTDKNMQLQKEDGEDMLLVAIVDDDEKDAALLKELVTSYFESRSISVMIHLFQDGLTFIRSEGFHDLVFLDIQMGKVNGLETAHFLRKFNQESVLIFVTNMAQFAIRGYEVDALDFIVKPATASSISYVLDKAMKRISGTGASMLSIRTPEGTVVLQANDLTYVEVYDHNLVYHTQTREYTVRGKLSEVMEKLDPSRFVLCNRSFIVNLRYVSSVSGDAVMIGDTRISVSKGHKKELMQRFSGFLGDNL